MSIIKDFYPNGDAMLKKQEELSIQYKYKALPPLISIMQREEYEREIPKVFLNNENKPLYSLSGVLLAKKWDRIVVGDYGAFIEIDNADIVRDNIMVKSGEEYRMRDPRYSEHVKYFWYVPNKGFPSKIYFQQKTVTYADYQPNKWYISPYECTL